MSLSHNQKHPNKTNKKRLNHDQVKLLEACFDATKKLEPERKFELARELGVPPRQIAIWYQNKRARWKNQSLETDYGAIQVKLESALAENKRLEEQVQNLKSELKRARDVLVGFKSHAPHHQGRVHMVQEYACAVNNNVTQISSYSSCCDEYESSSLNDDVGCSEKNNNNNNYNYNNNNWGDGGDHTRASNLQYEELYACLMLGPKGSISSCTGQVHDERDFWA